MFFRIKNWWKRSRFDSTAAKVLGTPPLRLKDSTLRIISSVSHQDLLMYLLAIKSFCRYVDHGKIIILNDGSLSAEDLRILQEHVSPTAIMHLDQIPYRHGTKGVRWGILLAISDLLDQHFVVHIDSDTLTLGHPAEVAEAIESNRSFTLGTNDGQEISSAKRCSDFVRQNQSSHVQIVAEKHLEGLPGSEHLNTSVVIRG